MIEARPVWWHVLDFAATLHDLEDHRVRKMVADMRGAPPRAAVHVVANDSRYTSCVSRYLPGDMPISCLKVREKKAVSA